MSFPWIKNSGIIAAQQIDALLRVYAGMPYYVCYCDRAITGGVLTADFTLPDPHCVLELRAFSENAELHIVRNSLDRDFQYRIAKDTGLDDKYYSDRTQRLDINTTVPVNVKDGCSIFTAVSGGRYALPVSPQARRIHVRYYVTYDPQTGRAEIADFRIRGID